MAVGAAFSLNPSTGVFTSLAIVRHFPREHGDFAVPPNSGMSMKQAVFYNLVSALTCFIGLFFGILLGEVTDMIFALAGGILVHIALIWIPELNEGFDKACDKGQWRKALKLLLLQNVRLILGVVALYVLAYHQDSLEFLGLG